MRLRILKFALSAGLLICVLRVAPPGRTGSTTPSGPSGEIYGGIYLSDEGITAIALEVSKGGEEPGFKLVYSEIIRLKPGRTSDGEFRPQESTDAAKAVSTALTRLRREYRAPLDQIYFIGSSGLGADHLEGLASVIRNTTGLTPAFLDAATEIQLSIAGTIPRTGKIGAASINNRSAAVLLHVGRAGTQGGYETVKYLSDPPSYDFVAMNIPHGVVSYTNEISRAVGPGGGLYAFTRQVKASGASAFRKSLRKEVEGKPGLTHRKRVFLTGAFVWAMATLLYPEDRGAFVSVTSDDIIQFAERVARSPQELTYRNVSFIRDLKLRQDVEQDMEEIRAAFTPEQLIAGAEMLKAAAEELKWREKNILFARFGHLGCILSYVRLQIEK
jgi:hypothetical protein